MQRRGQGGPYAAPFPAVHGDAARPRGGRDRPPYIAAENGQQPVSGSQLQRPTTGRCKHRPLRRGRVAAGRMRQSGRILPPCFAGCAAAGKGICKARCGTPPSPAATPPLTGEAFEAAAAQKGSPARGLDAPEGADGGVHCRLAAEISRKVRQGLAPVFRRVCGGRVGAAARKGICRIRCGTPPSPAATPPLTGEASGGGNAQKGAPARGAFQAAVCSKPPPR